MATKTEIKKWIKEILQPVIKPYGYKTGMEKKYTGAFGIYKETPEYFDYFLIDIYRDKTVQLSIFDTINKISNKKLVEITGIEKIEYATLMQFPETDPYYAMSKQKDFSYEVPIQIKPQLQTYLQPLIDNFANNVKLVNHYRYIPNLLKKWEEVEKIYEQTGNYEIRNSYFPSPYKYFHIYFFYRILNYMESDDFYKKVVEHYEDTIKKYRKKKHHLESTYVENLNNFKKLKTYFDTLSPEELAQLKEEFKPFLTPPKEESPV